MTPYKKRAKAGWSCGKEYKKESNRSERMYAKEELLELGYENPEEVLKQLEIGFQQIKDGKGLTTEEMKEKLKERREARS
jgi:hypothetical protein